MKIFTCTLLLAIIGSIGFAQTRQEIDSLKHELAIAKHDTNRVIVMVNLAVEHQNVNPDSALMYGQQALDFAKKIKFLRGEARAFYALGAVNRIIGDMPTALRMMYNGLQIAEENHLYSEYSMCLHLLGIFFWANLGDDVKGLKYLQWALRINQKIPKSKEKLRQEVQTITSIGNIYRERNQLDSASYYHHQAENLRQKENLKSTAGQISNLGRIEFLLGNHQKAIEYSRKAIQICKKENNYRTASNVYNTLATNFKDLNQPDSAIYYSKIGLTESQSIDYKDGILRNSRLLAELYESKDIKKAYEYQKIAATTNEEIYGAKKIQVLQKTIVDEIDRQRQMEVERIAYQNQLRQYAFLAGLGVLLLIAFILYRNNKQQKKANHLLHRQKEEINQKSIELEQSLETLKSTQAQLIQKEKLASLGELTAGIAHEIQNPLNFVNNFSELSVDLVKDLKEEIEKPTQDKEYIGELFDDLSQNQEKINHHGKRASSIVKGMLEHSRVSTGDRVPTDLNKLADEYLRLSYHGMRAKDGSFNADYVLIADENLPLINVVSQDIGRVLLNLVNNAFWAVGQRAKGLEHGGHYVPKVMVSTKMVNNQIIIKVSDNGAGIPADILPKIFQPFFTTKPTGQGTGLGLSLAYDIVKAHGGELKVNTKEGEGSEFIIQIPYAL